MKSHQTKVINRHLLISRAVEKGFNAFLPVYDDGIDLILHGGTPANTFLIQLKSRWLIDKKYIGRNLHMAFPHKGTWYLIPHDDMVASATKFTKTKSWTEKGQYHVPTLSKEMLANIQQYAF
jgi:hypothetical protein